MVTEPDDPKIVQMKERLKAYRKLEKKMENSYLANSPTKKTAEEILAFVSDPNYEMYLQTARDGIAKRIAEDEERLKKISPDVLDDIDDKVVADYQWALVVQRRLKKKVQKEFKTLSSREQDAIIEERLVREVGVAEPYDILVPNLHEIDAKRGAYTEEARNAQHIKGNIWIDKNYRCVITPDISESEIRDPNCDFGTGLWYFIVAFEEKIKHKRKVYKERKRFFAPRAASIKYKQLIEGIVNQTEVKDTIKRNVEQDIEFYVKNWRKFEESPERRNDQRWWDKKKQLEGAKKYWDYSKGEIKRDVVDVEAEEQAKATIETFVFKNVAKVAPFLNERPDCDEFVPDIRLDRGRIEGDIVASCKNGDSFRVNNQLVFVPGSFDRRAHYRFPTTFHDVKCGSEFLKMAPEEWMNENFGKKKCARR